MEQHLVNAIYGGLHESGVEDNLACMAAAAPTCFPFARFSGKVAHQVFVGISQQVVTFRAVPAEIEGGVLENADQVGEAVLHLLALAQFVGVVEVSYCDPETLPLLSSFWRSGMM